MTRTPHGFLYAQQQARGSVLTPIQIHERVTDEYADRYHFPDTFSSIHDRMDDLFGWLFRIPYRFQSPPHILLLRLL